MVVDWCPGWLSSSLLYLIELHLSSSFVWIKDTLMLFGLNFTASGVIELMYSALTMMVFYFNTMSLVRNVTAWNLEVILVST